MTTNVSLVGRVRLGEPCPTYSEHVGGGSLGQARPTEFKLGIAVFKDWRH